MRAVTAVPLHATASGLMGYHVGRAKFAANPGAERRLQNRGLAVAVLIHGTYNFLLFMGPAWGPVSTLGIVPLLIVSFFVLRRRIRMAVNDDRAAGRSGPGSPGVPPPLDPPEGGPPSSSATVPPRDD
jgi:RsiW-degrading membrane proteinase PrsW (M82 family)